MAIIIETNVTELTVEKAELSALRDWIAYQDQNRGVTVLDIMTEIDARIEFISRLISIAQSNEPPYRGRY